MSFWTLVAGLGTSIPAILTGLVEYAGLPPDAPSDQTATWHLILTGNAVTFFLLSLLVRGGPEMLEGGRLIGALLCSLVGLALLTAGGHLGAQLVYLYGVGRDHPPEST